MENLNLIFGETMGSEHAEISAQQYLDNKIFLDENYDIEFEDSLNGLPIGRVRVFEKLEN